MAGKKFSDFFGIKHDKKAKNQKKINYLGLAHRPQSFYTYHSISPTWNLGYQLKKTCPCYVMYVKLAFFR